MGKEEDQIAANHQAPETSDEWRVIRSGVDKAHKSWMVVGPVHAVVTNWRALAVVGIVLAWLNRPGIAEALAVLFGVSE
jgi:hypothetical protein